jgi:hypothetical protein
MALGEEYCGIIERDSTDKMDNLNALPATLHKQMLRRMDTDILPSFRRIQRIT